MVALQFVPGTKKSQIEALKKFLPRLGLKSKEMFIAKVVGNVWATRKHKSLESTKLLLVRRIDGVSGKFLDEDIMLAVDKYIDAGIGNTVLVMDEGGSARQILNDKTAPVRTIICGVVDSVSSGGKTKKWH